MDLQFPIHYLSEVRDGSVPLGIGGRVEIEFFDGIHETIINGVADFPHQQTEQGQAEVINNQESQSR